MFYYNKTVLWTFSPVQECCIVSDIVKVRRTADRSPHQSARLQIALNAQNRLCAVSKFLLKPTVNMINMTLYKQPDLCFLIKDPKKINLGCCAVRFHLDLIICIVCCEKVHIG